MPPELYQRVSNTSISDLIHLCACVLLKFNYLLLLAGLDAMAQELEIVLKCMGEFRLCSDLKITVFHECVSQEIQFWSCFEINFCFLVIRQMVTGIVVGVIALLFVSFSVFVLTVLYRRSLAIRRKRAMRRYMEQGEVSQSLRTALCCFTLVWF